VGSLARGTVDALRVAARRAAPRPLILVVHVARTPPGAGAFAFFLLLVIILEGAIGPVPHPDAQLSIAEPGILVVLIQFGGAHQVERTFAPVAELQAVVVMVFEAEHPGLGRLSDGQNAPTPVHLTGHQGNYHRSGPGIPSRSSSASRSYTRPLSYCGYRLMQSSQ